MREREGERERFEWIDREGRGKKSEGVFGVELVKRIVNIFLFIRLTLSVQLDDLVGCLLFV